MGSVLSIGDMYILKIIGEGRKVPFRQDDHADTLVLEGYAGKTDSGAYYLTKMGCNAVKAVPPELKDVHNKIDEAVRQWKREENSQKM